MQSVWTITKLVSEDRCCENSRHGSYIKFAGFMNRGLFYRGQEQFAYRNGIYEVNCSGEDRIYEQKINNIKGIGDYERDMLRQLVDVLKNQKHGTAVVIVDDELQIKDKINETDHLCGFRYGTKILSSIQYDSSDRGWDEELLLSITSIDGALFIDSTGRCLAIGVIVDGEVCQIGDAGRGSRYNSIFNYVTNKEVKGFLELLYLKMEI